LLEQLLLNMLTVVQCYHKESSSDYRTWENVENFSTTLLRYWHRRRRIVNSLTCEQKPSDQQSGNYSLCSQFTAAAGTARSISSKLHSTVQRNCCQYLVNIHSILRFFVIIFSCESHCFSMLLGNHLYAFPPQIKMVYQAHLHITNETSNCNL
jgi:hypothetical protein